MLFVALLGLGPQGRAQRQPCSALTESIVDAKFSPGQVWTYDTRPGEQASTLTVLRIDRGERFGVVVHVRIDGLQVHNPRGELVPLVEHMPFTRDALLGSVDKLLRIEPVLPTLEGLQSWQAHCGGVYTISVQRAVEVMERTFNSR